MVPLLDSLALGATVGLGCEALNATACTGEEEAAATAGTTVAPATEVVRKSTTMSTTMSTDRVGGGIELRRGAPYGVRWGRVMKSRSSDKCGGRFEL